MSLLGNWLWGTSQLDEAIDKATSELLPAGSSDIALELEICDQIRSKSVPAKDAVRALKRRLGHKNPNVQNLALELTDVCVKNAGDAFLTEIASREFMDNLVSILKMPALNSEVKANILRVVQNWSTAFESKGKGELKYVGAVYKTLVHEGFKFPPLDLTESNSAMLDTQTAPEWIDSEVCLRCRTAFTFTNRKHHCRNCGGVFDQACSSRTAALPRFGITQEVRVCDSCWPTLKGANDVKDQRETRHRSRGHRHSQSLHSARSRAQDDADLQRAISLSLQEVGQDRHGYTPYQPAGQNYQYFSEPPIVDRASRLTEDEEDPDLKAAIEASLRESNAPRASAPVVITETPRTEYPSYAKGFSQSYPPTPQPQPPQNQRPYELEPLESDAIMTFSQTVEQVQGRDMTRYPAVSELYDRANSLRPKLVRSMDDAGKKEQVLSEMHDKLSQAVKLYDKLLTEQVVYQPRWQTYQPPAQTSPGYGTQWHPAQSPAPQQPQQYAPPQQYYTSPSWQAQAYSPAPAASSSAQYASVPSTPVSVQYQPQPQSPPPASYQPQYQSPAPPSVQYQPAPVAQSPAPPVSAQYQPSAPPGAQYAPPPAQSPPVAQPQYQTPNDYSTRLQPQQHQQPMPQQQTMPVFPIVPTSAPQAFPMYGAASMVPTSPPVHQEREVALIDL
ncbi:unnamed protein product [Mycena citricolor]|uniref:Vacuolar protein sorting-associated protein 27 n=1 Tax=Mycena citricolor TaxID=2018698 RepID=A0AAD2Q113_9AGAR|nr:unnamed protein product [Mycena citricolor]